MPVGLPSPIPLFPVQPEGNAVYPRESGAAVFGKPYLKFAEAKVPEGKREVGKPPSPLEDTLEGNLKALLAPKADRGGFPTAPREAHSNPGIAKPKAFSIRTLGGQLDFEA